jgi:uncharacterized membrane protein YqiK
MMRPSRNLDTRGSILELDVVESIEIIVLLILVLFLILFLILLFLFYFFFSSTSALIISIADLGRGTVLLSDGCGSGSYGSNG